MITPILKKNRLEDIGGITITIGGVLVQILRFENEISVIADIKRNLKRML